MRTKDLSIQKTEEILRRISENYYLAWDQKVKGTKFTLMGYFVLGEIFIVQVFDDGSIYHFCNTGTMRWDLTEKKMLDHFKEISGFQGQTI